MADEDIDVDRFRRLAPAKKEEEAEPIIDENRFRAMTAPEAAPKRESVGVDLADVADQVRDLVRSWKGTLSSGEIYDLQAALEKRQAELDRIDAMDAAEDGDDEAVLDALFEAEEARQIDAQIENAMRQEPGESDDDYQMRRDAYWNAKDAEEKAASAEREKGNFDPRLDEVVALFQKKYNLGIIAEAGWHEGWDDLDGPEAWLFVLDAPVNRERYQDNAPDPNRDAMDDFLAKCVKLVERKYKIANPGSIYNRDKLRVVADYVPPQDTPYAVEDLSKAETDGRSTIRSYPVGGLLGSIPMKGNDDV